MRIRIVPYSLVAADKAAIEAVEDTSHPSSRSQRFSTAKHTRDEMLPVAPESVSFKHADPPWTPYCYTLWQPLVVESQQIASIDRYIGTIPSFVATDILGANMTWAARGKVSTASTKDICESWASTNAGKEILGYLDGSRKWFVRLGQMSPKDSPLGGKSPSLTMFEVVTKLYSSMRAQRCLEYEFRDAESEAREPKIELILNLWNQDIDAAHEYRVFVPPPAASGRSTLSISAISQYRWPFPFAANSGLTIEQTMESVYQGAVKILAGIERFAKSQLKEKNIYEMLMEYGLSFDVWLKNPGDVRLIEINPFGALSGCGACLFNWIIDGRVLYGLEEPIFTVTLEEEQAPREDESKTSILT